jgi:hypothetical protein
MISPDFNVAVTNSNWRFTFVSCHDFPSPDYVHKWPNHGGNIGLAPFDWNLVKSRNISALVWAGDIIYGDFPKNVTWLPDWWSYVLPEVPLHLEKFTTANGSKLNNMYRSLKEDGRYKALLESLGNPLRHIGTWDDHDYGINDGDQANPYKHESKDAFLDFFSAGASDPRRSRDGVYSSTLFASNTSSVLVVALDLRFNRSPYGTPGCCHALETRCVGS